MGPQLIDDSINIRLWRLAERGRDDVLEQGNLYQSPKAMSGPSTRFRPYLTGNAMEGRPDGYGLRSWLFAADGELLNVCGGCMWGEGAGGGGGDGKSGTSTSTGSSKRS